MIIKTCCIIVTEEVTLSNLIANASHVSEVWPATDRHTHRQTDDMVCKTLKTKTCQKDI